MRTAILASGSREWTDMAVVCSRLNQYPAGTILIHGDARGLDRIAASVGRTRRFNIHAMPYFRDLGLAGGQERNRCMFGALLNLQRFGFDVFAETFPLRPVGGTQNMIALIKTYNTRSAKPVPLWVFPNAV